MAIKHCPVCGKELEEDAAVCKLCGTDISAPVQNNGYMRTNDYNTVPPVSPAANPVSGCQPQYAQCPQNVPYAVPQYGVYQPMPVYIPAKVQKPGKGAAIASLVIGIIAIVFALSLLLDGISFFDKYNGNTAPDNSVTYETGNDTSDSGYRSDKNAVISEIAFTTILSVLAVSLGIVGRKHGMGIAGTVLGGLSFVSAVLTVILVLSVYTGI